MMHQGREIFGAWFDALITGYREQYGDAGLPASTAEELMANLLTVHQRLDQINEDGVRGAMMDPHAEFLRKYTSIAATSKLRDASPPAVKQQNRDSMDFL